MQAARFEGSLLTSLKELKSIEQQRLAEERAVVQRAEELRIQELVDNENRRREAAEAKLRAEHEAQLALEHARAEAEREARLRVEAAEAAEQARQLLALTESRTAQELELRRAEVARKRPTWMLAVTALAVVLAGVLVWFTVGAFQTSAAADEARIEANRKTEEAKRHAEESRIALAAVEREVKELDAKVTVAIAKLEAARTKAERDAAAAELKKANDAKADAARHAEKVRLEMERREREKPVDVGADCRNSVLCKKAK